MNFGEFIFSKFKIKQINDYLSIRSGTLFYEDLSLMKLINEYGNPIEVAYVKTIEKRIKQMKKIFNEAIVKNKYEGNFIYAYATKANYYSEVVTTALNEVNALETTSAYDLEIIKHLIKRNLFPKNIKIFCNGFKHGNYFKNICELKMLGINIIPIIENEMELELFAKTTELNFEIGIRLNVNENLIEYCGLQKDPSLELKGRFGFDISKVFKVAEKIKTYQNINLKLLHFHVGGMIKDSENFSTVAEKIFEKVYIKIKENNPALQYLNLGGGLPTQYEFEFKFDYENFANLITKKIKAVAKRFAVKEPDLIGEYGRYTVNDHGFSIYSIELSKPTENKDELWYFVNGSLMTNFPDMWGIKQNFMILPINGWHRKFQKVRLGGITCDPDDTYYSNEVEQVVYLPELLEHEPLYIGIFGTGAYQDMISGVKGVHHCLLPEAKELIVYKNKENKHEFDLINQTQTYEHILKSLDYKEEHKLERYLKTSDFNL